MTIKTLLVVSFALIASGPPRFFGGGELDEAFGANVLANPDYLVEILVWGFAALAVGLVATRGLPQGRGIAFPLSARTGSAKWYSLYAVVCLISTVWSSAPLYTLFFASKMLIAILVVSYLVDRDPPDLIGWQVLKALVYVFAVGFAVTVLSFFINPELVGRYEPHTGSYRLAGGTFSGFGSEALLTGLAALVYLRYYARRTREQVLAVLVYAVTWVFLLMSLTRGAIFIGLLGLVVIGFMGRLSLSRMALMLFGVSFFIMLMSFDKTVNLFFSFTMYATRGMEHLDTLTGRTLVAEYLLALWKESPVLGHGYASSSRLALIEYVELTGRKIASAHGSSWKALVEVGVVGATFMFISFTLAWYETIRILRRSAQAVYVDIIGRLAFIFMVSASLSMVTNDSFADGSLRVIVLLVVVASVNRRLDLVWRNSGAIGPFPRQPHGPVRS